ncbi:MAG: gliding motility-associated C-terminal domain-containing protein [Bacteroidia bacterium]|jgi:gliding motility-associated-like protein|nr:gliding motility-associated C-terminal domain-containing protein [Bacteroidia bacterium]
MAKRLFFLFLLSTQVVIAQRQNDTWVMGTGLGMQWDANRSLRVIPDPVGGFARRYAATACYSNPQTGVLQLIVDQEQFYTGNYQAIPNSNWITPNGDKVVSVGIVPLLNNEFYVFAVTEFNSFIYNRVKITSQGGTVVFGQAQPLLNNTDKQFTAIRMPNGQGYWVITHQNTSNVFTAIPINGIGNIGQSVVSVAGEFTIPPSVFNTGEMIATTDGNRFVLLQSDPNGSVGNPTYLQEFTFDKRCGKIQLRNTITFSISQLNEFFVFAAYSPDNRLLYVSSENSVGQNTIVQYNMQASDPNSTRTLIANSNEVIGDLQNGPDGKIYATSSVQRTFTSRISVIPSPNSLGTACGFLENNIELSRSPFLGSIGVERFPQLLADVDTTGLFYQTPAIQVRQTCLGAPTLFSLFGIDDVTQDIAADSFYWKQSDGTIIRMQQWQRLYSSPTVDSVEFVWFLCNREFKVSAVFTITQKPGFSLGPDQTICFGSAITLTGPSNATRYVWNTGDTTQTLNVANPGTYQLTVWNGDCPSSDTFVLSQYEPIFTALGEEYFICEDDRELVRLDAGEQFAQYKWSPTGDTTQWIVVGNVGDYFVVVKDFRGCDGSDGTRVKRKCGVLLTFPNAFTPNNDGVNDVFGPVSKDLVSIELIIYNRWGDEVWRTQKVGELWNGEVNGVPAMSGVYTYSCSYTGFENKRIKNFNKKGTFTLLR